MDFETWHSFAMIPLLLILAGTIGDALKLLHDPREYFNEYGDGYE